MRVACVIRWALLLLGALFGAVRAVLRAALGTRRGTGAGNLGRVLGFEAEDDANRSKAAPASRGSMCLPVPIHAELCGLFCRIFRF